MKIALGIHTLEQPLMLAPMAGVSDVPFRELCVAHGASVAVGEMLSCNVDQWHSRKNRDRLRRSHTTGPEIVQIAGSDPELMAEAARRNVAMGADVIDINMGCPAKKVLQKAAGSALLKDPDLVRQILDRVVTAVDVPVTLKIRTGWSPDQRNGVDIAHIAEDAGIAMLTVHGRTRQCRFKGQAEYDTIAIIKQSVSIPVIANGDITTPAEALSVLSHTNADGLMIGRGAQGRPWIFAAIRHFLQTGQHLPEPDPMTAAQILLDHVQRLHAFYDPQKALVFARKHMSWYQSFLPGGHDLKTQFNRLESLVEQIDTIHRYQEALSKLSSDGNLDVATAAQSEQTITAVQASEGIAA